MRNPLDIPDQSDASHPLLIALEVGYSSPSPTRYHSVTSVGEHRDVCAVTGRPVRTTTSAIATPLEGALSRWGSEDMSVIGMWEQRARATHMPWSLGDVDAVGGGELDGPLLLIDAVLGTPGTLGPWEEQLQIWPSLSRRGRIGPDGKFEDLGREMPDVHQRLDAHLKARTTVRLGELLGDTSRAREVLSGMIEILNELDEVADPPD